MVLAVIVVSMVAKPPFMFGLIMVSKLWFRIYLKPKKVCLLCRSRLVKSGYFSCRLVVKLDSVFMRKMSEFD